MLWLKDFDIGLVPSREKVVRNRINVWLLWDKLDPKLISDLAFIFTEWNTFRPFDVKRKKRVVKDPFQVCKANMDWNVWDSFKDVL